MTETVTPRSLGGDPAQSPALDAELAARDTRPVSNWAAWQRRQWETVIRAAQTTLDGAHGTPQETGTGPSPAERAGAGDPDGPESPQSHAEASGRESARADGSEPGSVALVPSVAASGGFGDCGPSVKAVD